jgi:hypothetical protein
MSEKPIDPQKALLSIVEMAPQYAQAKANCVYLDEYRKTVKAQCMQAAESAGHRSSAAQEREAYAAPQYIAHLEAIRAAHEAAEALRWRLVAAQQAVEVWRSLEASGRAMDRGTR